MAFFDELMTDYTLRTVALGALVIGAIAGALGSFALLRRQSLVGDAVSHAALPGIALAFLVTGAKTSLVLLAGAAVAGWLGMLLVLGVTRTTRIREDSALGLVLSVFFGFGLVLLTFIARTEDAGQAGLDTFLFGQAAGVVGDDLVTMLVVGAAVLLPLGLFWKEFKLLAFDPVFAASIGLPVRALDVLLTLLLVLAIVIGLQTVGVVLMSAMLIAPPAAARQWTDRLGVMVALSAALGALSGLAGAVASAAVPHLPTGPSVVLVAATLAIFSLLFAGNRGLVWRGVRARRARRRIALDAVLLDLYHLAREHEDPTHAHPAAVFRVMGRTGASVERALERLRGQGLVRQDESQRWALSPKGLVAAERIAVDAGREGEEGR